MIFISFIFCSVEFSKYCDKQKQNISQIVKNRLCNIHVIHKRLMEVLYLLQLTKTNILYCKNIFKITIHKKS
nr:MAG TPA: hypothetical protein [Caudoviricetes sp.]